MHGGGMDQKLIGAMLCFVENKNIFQKTRSGQTRAGFLFLTTLRIYHELSTTIFS
jgi:hypothetical protein